MSIENVDSEVEFYLEDEYVDSKCRSSFGKLLELSWDSPKYLTNLKGLFQLIEVKYISNCDFPLNPTKLQSHTFEFLRSDQNKTIHSGQHQLTASELPTNLNLSFLLLKSVDDIKATMISLDLLRQVLPALCESQTAEPMISRYISTLFEGDRLVFHPELLNHLKSLRPVEKASISKAFCGTILGQKTKNRDFYNFLLTNSFIFDIIDFSSAQEFWSHVPTDVVELNQENLVRTLDVSCLIEFYAYLPKFYRLLKDSPEECDQLLRVIKNKDFNIFLLLLFNLFINKFDLLS